MGKYWLRVEALNLLAFIMDTQDLSTARGGSLAMLDVISKIDSRCGGETSSWRVPGWTAVTKGASIGVWHFEGDEARAAELEQRVSAWLAGQGAGDRDDPFTAARHGSFQVVALPVSDPGFTDAGSFITDRERLIAEVRRRQMRFARLVYPRETSLGVPVGVKGRDGWVHEKSDEAIRVCSVDFVRPAIARTGKQAKIPINGEKNAAVSRSVWDRRGYGLLAKQNFYCDLLGEAYRTDQVQRRIAAPKAAPFALQMTSISERRGSGHVETLRRPLEGKIAVLYMDGNRFSKLQDAFIQYGDRNKTALERQTIFDEEVRGNRRSLLARILARLLEDDIPGCGPPSEEERELRDALNAADDRRDGLLTDSVVRFETLLWGGDEMMFAVPARFGWEIARLIVAETSRWAIDFPDSDRTEMRKLIEDFGAERKQPDADDTAFSWRCPMHHAIGLVFCHDDAPISRIQGLARDLAEHAKQLRRVLPLKSSQETEKEEEKQDDGRKHTLIVPMVLESFDHIGGRLEPWLERRAPSSLRGTPETSPEREIRDRAVALTGAELEALMALAKKASGDKARLSRRKLRLIANSLHQGISMGPRSIKKLKMDAPNWIQVIIQETPRETPYKGEFEALTGFGYERLFLLLEEHWDYLLPLLDEQNADEADGGNDDTGEEDAA